VVFIRYTYKQVNMGKMHTNRLKYVRTMSQFRYVAHETTSAKKNRVISAVLFSCNNGSMSMRKWGEMVQLFTQIKRTHDSVDKCDRANLLAETGPGNEFNPYSEARN
jgi:hypothetical protein